MTIWLVRYHDTNDGTVCVTLWDTRVGAYMDVCAAIIDDINTDWDFNNVAAVTAARSIEDFIRLQQWEDAVECWNEWSDQNNIGIFWEIFQEGICTIADVNVPAAILWPATPQTNSNNNTPTPVPVASASCGSGATCRGPCGQFNSYADPDQANGTYVCSQCKTFGSIFG
jgi:hypothetical protein